MDIFLSFSSRNSTLLGTRWSTMASSRGGSTAQSTSIITWFYSMTSSSCCKSRTTDSSFVARAETENRERTTRNSRTRTVRSSNSTTFSHAMLLLVS